MNPRALNLLRHPGRGRSLAPGQLRAWVAAGLIGALLGGLCSGWQHMRLTRLHEQRDQLLVRVQYLTHRQADAATLHEQARLRGLLSERAATWQERRQQQLRLHQALNMLADAPGLRAQRWEGETHRLVLHAWLPQSDGVVPLMAQLSDAWPHGWSLQSLGQRPADPGGAGGVEAVLESPRPSAATGSAPSRP